MDASGWGVCRELRAEAQGERSGWEADKNKCFILELEQYLHEYMHLSELKLFTLKTHILC